MPSSDPNNGDGFRDAAVAKTAGFVAFSGIALSIIKAITSKNPQRFEAEPSALSFKQPQPLQPQPQPQPQQQQQYNCKPKKPAAEEQLAHGSSSTSVRTVEIVKGDTLWGLSREYGVTINAIKEANGITGDTIYAGKKLIIP